MPKIKKITVQNLKAVDFKELELDGASILVIGGNNKGKSTLLKTFPDRLRGIKPDVVLKENTGEGFAELELTTGEKLRWDFGLTKKGEFKEKLTYISEKQIPTSATKEICRAYFPESFNVDKFLNSPPSEQRKVMQKVAGIEFTELDKALKEAEETRAYRNKRVKELQAQIQPVDETLPTTPKDPAEILASIQKNQELKSEIDTHNGKISSIQATIKSNSERCDELRKEIARLQEQNVNLEGEEDDLKEKVLSLQDNLLPAEDEEKLRQSLSSIAEDNKKIALNNIARENAKKLEQEEKFAAEAQAEVDRVLADKDEAIKSGTLPEGFGFDNEGITYNGFPFSKETLSSSALYIAALKLASTIMGHVHALHFDASYLDKNSLKEVWEWAEANDLQLLIEKPDFEGGEIHYETIHEGLI